MFCYVCGAALSVGCILSARLFMRAYKQENYVRAFWLKGGAALCFVLLAAILAAESENRSYGCLVLIGLALGLCGDELLALRFVFPRYHDLLFATGAGAFGVGHVFYMKALYDLGGITLGCLIPVLLTGLILAWLYGRKNRSHAGPLQFAAVGYMTLVVFMGSVTVSAFLANPCPGLLLFALGGICFGVSDNVLLAFCYGNSRTWDKNIVVHITYYAAQLLIAWSILLIK
jgi:uncharacterized membrane protein YhhN